MKLKWFIISLSASVFFILSTVTITFAGWFTLGYYAFLQVAAPNSNLVLIMIYKTDTKKKCENAIQDWQTGIRTTCPECIFQDSKCSKTLPLLLKDVFDNKSGIFPYIVIGKTRVIFVGVPLELGNQLCEQRTNYYTNILHEKALCIRAVNPEKGN